jgi:hypothetical protein
MALDLSGAFTIGGLDPGRGSGVKLLMMSGELVGLDGNGTYTITADGTVTATGGETADLSLTQGAGQIIVSGYDATGEGVAANVEFVFGGSKLTVAAGGIEILGGIANFGWDIAGGTVGSAAVDMISPTSLKAISGNAIQFIAGAPYENEAGTQIAISPTTILKFSVLAFAQGGVTGN